jgi:glycosyltransferase involved in cell wall biosynthesis
VSDPVIYLVRSWPRLSQTFIVNEVLALERRGLDLVLFSLVRSDEVLVQPQVHDVRAPVSYLGDDTWRQWTRAHAEVLKASPLRYIAALWFALVNQGLSHGYATSTTLGCFRYAGQVAAAVQRLGKEGRPPAHLHAHFAHDPALVALLVKRLTGVAFTFTAHARDLYQIPAQSLEARASEASAVITCCQVNAEYISAAIPAVEDLDVRVIHHGVELGQFLPRRESDPRRTQESDLREVGRPPLVSIGRMVEKKGFADLLHALYTLRTSGVPFTCSIYGDGPLRPSLTQLRDSLGLGDDIRFRGERDREGIVDALRAADVFVLTPVVTPDGDRDGIPNVLVEAMACGLPVVATAAGGVGELVVDAVNGYLNEPGDVAGVSKGLSTLLGNPELRSQMGRAARRTVECEYDVDTAARHLEKIFDSATA